MPTHRSAPRPWLAPTLLATLVGGMGALPQYASAASPCPQFNSCRLQGTLTPRIVIEASGAAGKDGKVTYVGNGGWATDGENGKTARIISDNSTSIKGIGQLPGSGAAVLHASTSGGRGGDAGEGKAGADGVGGTGGRGGTLRATLQGSYHNTSSLSNAGAIALYSRGGSSGYGYHNKHVNNAPAGSGGTIEVRMENGGTLDVATRAGNAVGLLLDAEGGAGGMTRKLAGWQRPRAGDGGAGGSITLNTNGTFQGTGTGSIGIRATSNGGAGGTALGGVQFKDSTGGTGGRGGEITGSFGQGPGSHRIETRGAGILLSANGGYGGRIEYASGFNAPDGGIGGQGGSISFQLHDTQITTRGNNAPGISAEASGGAGFWGGDSVLGKGGMAGKGGDGGTVDLALRGGSIVTHGSQSYGAMAVADGGGGHTGGKGGVFSRAGNGSQGGRGGNATLVNHSQVATHGRDSIGLYVSSLGGKAGDGGRGSSIVAVGGNGGMASAGGGARLENHGVVATQGEGAHALFAQTVGGGGGVVIPQSGQKMTIGGDSNSYSPSASGGGLRVVNTGTATTQGKRAVGLAAQSIGGGGGAGGKAAGLIAIGGHGAAGGNAGLVEVAQNGLIATAQEESVGVLAQSVGGGGGYGGDVFTIGPGVNVGIGGRGGAGGKGGRVNIKQDGEIATEGRLSAGLVAQSIGGGGGQGGSVTGIGTVTLATVTIGGSGGSGGSADRVDLDGISGAISTAGAGSDAIKAQSVGGGGGSGGNSTSISVGLASVGIGGTGGTGGHGGQVRAVNHAQLSTLGDGSSGIIAQSIGGGGGDGGSAAGATIGLPTKYATFSASVQVGGKGGGAGNGARVAILNDGAISTQGREARGIIAQSIGGGGGKGGSASAHSLSIHPKLSFSASVALGGSGGGGGAGGVVDITHQGQIHTAGSHADGIVAQSIGGGGGLGAAGSAHTSAIGAKTFSLAFALGGSGGEGGQGGRVNLQHEGAIHTQGALSRGILLQSVGGGGGDSSGADGGAESETVESSTILGGRGGKGGHGGTISLVASAASTLRTDGDEAIGILAQSVGGGGGTAGLTGTAEPDDDNTAETGAADKDKDKKDDSISVKLQFSLGGGGGAGGQGGRVNVQHAGHILTTGSQSTAILAQSVGGGGGAAAAARNKSDKGNVALNLAIGGSGGSGGNGGAVQVEQSGVIQTQGGHAHGIFAQSVGGGGGLGSVNAAASDARINLGGALGGAGGGHGHGGAVTVDNKGSISTQGRDSYAILAQSIGGGGGVASINAQSGDDKKDGDDKEEESKSKTLHLSIGGNGGTGGNGGNVTVAHHDKATLLTTGQNAHAILAQSVGGGGGVGIQSETTDKDSLAIQIGGKGGGAGAGGKITITTEGDITTQGAGAYGILAQSVGGGGGIGGDSSLRIIDSSNKLPSSSSGRSGKGGDIAINHHGRIHTSGANAAGILAQSVGGGGGISGDAMGASGGNRASSQGGAISITVGGEIRTQGRNSPAIFAQSLGAGGSNGNINITVADGGYVSGSHGPQGAGIVVHGGNNNSILVEQGGTVTALSSHAIHSAPGTWVATTNRGHVAGSIDLGGHARNGFTNQGRFDTGASVRLGADATLRNQGILNPHGAGVIGETRLLSSLRQHGGTSQGPATLEVDADFRDRRSDVLRYSKPVELGGQVHTLARYPLPNRALTIVQAAEGGGSLALAPDLLSKSSLVYRYPLQQPTDKSLAVSVEADFQAHDTELNEDQRNLAGYLQQAWRLEPSEDLYDTAVLFDQLVNVQNLEQYRKALDTLASDAGQGPAAYIPLSNRSFFTRMMSCPQFYQQDTAMREGDCAWGRFLGNHTRRDTTSETGGFTVNSQTYQLGGQKEVAPNWFLGGSVAYESSRHRVSDVPVRTEGDGFQAGVVLKRQAGPWLFAGSLTGGHGTYRTQRSIVLTDQAFEANSRWRTRHVSAGLRASYVHARPSWYLKPMLDVSLTYQRMPSYSESGAGPLNLHVDGASQWSSMITPSIELGGRYEWRGNTLRPYVSAGVSWLSDTGWDINARLEGDPEQRRFGLTTDLPRHFGELKAGMVLTRKNGVELKAEYGMRFADNYLSQTGELRLAVHF